MQYIVHTRFKSTAICGHVNIPAGTICDVDNGFIMHCGQRVCATRSENAHNYFALNDDGNGMVRGSLTKRIVCRLRKRDRLYQDRWNAIWNDPVCLKYKRLEHENHWLWNHAFFNAKISDLQYILNLISTRR